MTSVGPVSIDDIQTLTECGRALAVNIAVESKDASPMVAIGVRVDTVTVAGIVNEIIEVVDNTVVVALENGAVVTVPPTAIIKKDSIIIIDPPNLDIGENDDLTVIGLNTCEGDDYFLAYMVTIQEPL